MSSVLRVHVASMNAGKSLELLVRAHCYTEMGKKVLLFTAAIDDRSKVGQITSRIGISREAQTFDEDTDFFKIISDAKGIACCLIDEAQFMSASQATQLARAVALCKVDVLAYCLRTDFRGVPFAGSAALLSYADEIEMINAICECGNRSSMNIRLDDQGNRVTEGDQILIGGNSRYKQVCAHHFWLGAGSP
jgi:thymidine kinase